MISSTAAQRVTAKQVDETTLDMGMDHALVTTAIHITSNTQIKQQAHRKLVCGGEDVGQYNQLVREHLDGHTNPQTMGEALTTLHTAITRAVTTIHPRHIHRTKGKHGTRIQADIRVLVKILRCIKRGTDFQDGVFSKKKTY
jgi:hypothetical protein